MKKFRIRCHFEEIAIIKNYLHEYLKITVTSHQYDTSIATFHLRHELTEAQELTLHAHLFMYMGGKLILK